MQRSLKRKLFQAVRQGDLSKVQAVFAPATREDEGEEESLLNAVNSDARTVLHLAAECGHESVIRWLLSDKEGGGRALGFTNVLRKSRYGCNAFHFAAETGHLECCKAIAEGCKAENGEREQMLNAIAKDETTVLHLAATNNREEIIRWLLSDEGGRALGFSKVLAKDRRGETALHIAIQKGHLECCRAIAEGCKVDNGEREQMLNTLTKEEITLLHLAAWNGHESVVRWIMRDAEGGGRALGFFKVLARNKVGQTALHIAAENGDLECCKAIIEGCKVDNGEREEMLDVISTHEGTVLHVAATNNREEVIRWLLSDEGGRALGFTKVLAKDRRGYTALHLAIQGSHLKCCKAIAEGCKVENGEREQMLNVVMDGGNTVLHVAAFGGSENIIRWLLSNEEGGGRALGLKSETVTALTENSESALHKAVFFCTVPSVRSLLSGCTAGERIKLFLAVNKSGWTPLHFASKGGRIECIQELLSWEEAKVTVNVRDHRGMTALHRLACDGGLGKESRMEWFMLIYNPTPAKDVVRALLGLSPQTAGAVVAAAAFVDVNAGLEIPEEIKAAAAAKDEAKKRAASQDEESKAKRSRS